MLLLDYSVLIDEKERKERLRAGGPEWPMVVQVATHSTSWDGRRCGLEGEI